MTLKDLVIQQDYRSDRCDLIREFYLPCLKNATLYQRAVGFFSSSSMALVARGLTALIRAGGRMQLIASPQLSAEDIEAIASGLRQRDEIINQVICQALEQDFSEIVCDRLGCLAWLLAHGFLEIKIAVVKNIRQQGIYHEKLGIFHDTEQNLIAFTGSANESSAALMDNFECIDVYCSWQPSDSRRALRKAENFQHLWNNTTENVEVIEFPEAARRSLLRFCPAQKPEWEPILKKLGNSSTVSEPKGNYQVAKNSNSNLWSHQDEAIATFLQHRCGILEMATGTGKTRTALNILKHLVETKQINSAIITATGTDLLEQWVKQLYAVASCLTPSFRVLQHYDSHYQRAEYEIDPQQSVLVVSRNSLRSVLRSLTRSTRSHLLIIHDEVHGLGSPGNIEELDGLSEGIAYRLGLSATPEREYDETGTKFIEKNVGSVIYRFSLENAIKRGILCEFDYYALEYELTDEDRQKIKTVYSQKAARMAEGKPMSDEEFWTALARVYKTSRTKLPYLEMFLSQHPEVLDRCIVFVEDRQYGEEVLDIIHRYRYDFHTYYADDDRQRLADFAEGKIACLITCHRISQGIDIPSLQSTILLSSARVKLETIQRIGRCLRKDPKNPDKRAVVVDFVRTQDEKTLELNPDQMRKEWLGNLSKIRCQES